MGLDIYFYKANKAQYDEYQAKMANFETFSEEEKEIFRKQNEDICEEELYFRKVNFLMAFFNYEGNCEDKIIFKDEVEMLLSSCQEVLDKKNEETSEEILPTQDGFFFGSTEYNDYYYEDVQEVYDKFKNLNDNFNYEEDYLIMNCWW